MGAQLRQKRSIGNLWDNFVEVTKLHNVVERMRELVKDENQDMIVLREYLKGDNFSAIATCLRESPDYVNVKFKLGYF